MKSKRVSGRLLSSAFCLTLSLGAMTGMAQAKVTDKDIVNDQATPGDVVSYGLGPRGQRFSPIDTMKH